MVAPNSPSARAQARAEPAAPQEQLAEAPRADKPAARAKKRIMRDDFAAGVPVVMEEEARLPYFRQYAHSVRPERAPGDRVDFTETLYWNAGLRTDAKTGELRVSFGLNDSVTAFKASAGAVGAEGALGSPDQLLDGDFPALSTTLRFNPEHAALNRAEVTLPSRWRRTRAR